MALSLSVAKTIVSLASICLLLKQENILVSSFTPTAYNQHRHNILSSTTPSTSSPLRLKTSNYQFQHRRQSIAISASNNQDLGSSAKPYEKQKIAVFGAGGYLASTVYGFLQRASALYGTGIASASSSPRAICATSVGAGSLNTLLGRNFKLAFAGENYIALTDMDDVDHIKGNLKGYDAAVLGTVYTLTKKPVTANTYGKTPNDKTMEFFMDDRAMVDPDEVDLDMHLTLFRNTIEACKSVGMKHLVVMETPSTEDSKPFAEILDEAQIPFTYIRASGELENSKLYTFEEGVQSDLNVDGFTLSDGYASKNGYTSGDWSESLMDEVINDEGNVVPREDLAAVAVQCLMSLDWNKSRCINVSSKGALVKKDQTIGDDGKYVAPKILKSDKDWLVQSDIIAAKVRAVE